MKSLLRFNPPIFPHKFKPPFLTGVSCFLLLLYSCSVIKIPGKGKGRNLVEENAYTPLQAQDYADHFASLKKSFLNTPGVNQVRLDRYTTSYFQNVLSEIISKNEIFFLSLRSAEVTVIDSEMPLHFSLPKGEIFLSRGLITKYIKHESMLVSILAFELVRSEKLLYPKDVIIPTGSLPLERIIMLSRLSLEEKMQVHKWAHHLTERSGYDGEYYLSWLQTQNRNTADFLLQVGDANLITREEALFKAHLIKTDTENNVIKKNSSKNFYTLLNKLRDNIL